jgi:cobalt-zinc-cadmium efflux system membrane fusion protein
MHKISSKQKFLIVMVVVITVLLGVFILKRDISGVAHEHGDHAGHANENQVMTIAKGPHGGKYFTKNDFSVEVTIFETGVPPQFRFYLYENNKPIAPNAATVKAALTRLGKPAQLFNFKPEADYLLGDAVVEEPHSFDVAITAQHQGKSYQWNYSQVEARTEMSDEVLKSTGIEILTAGPAIIKANNKLSGEITFNEDSVLHIVPRVGGLVTAVKVDHGQMVHKGDVLAIVESQFLAELRSQLSAAQKRLSLAKITLEREKALWEEKVSAEQDYLAAGQAYSEAEIARNLVSEKLSALGASSSSHGNLTRYEIRSPISGVVVEKTVAAGQTVQENDNLFVVADTSQAWVKVTIYPKDLNNIKIGQKAVVKANAFDAEGEGVISYIGAFVGEKTRTATARIVLNNKAGLWRSGVFVDVILDTGEVEVPVAVTADAIQSIRGWTAVFGRYDNFFEARPLELGRSDGNVVEVLSGLSAGEQYAAGNSFAIKADIGKSGASHDH